MYTCNFTVIVATLITLHISAILQYRNWQRAQKIPKPPPSPPPVSILHDFHVLEISFYHVLQVRILLGPYSWCFPLHMMMPIPYLAVQVERWDGRREIRLPADTQFGADIVLFIDIVRMANKVDGWEKLIPTCYQRMLDHIYLADYLSAQSVLEELARFLGTQASKIDGYPRGAFHQRVRNAYRMSKYLKKRHLALAENCRICCRGLIPEPPNLPATYRLPCCNASVHSSFN